MRTIDPPIEDLSIESPRGLVSIIVVGEFEPPEHRPRSPAKRAQRYRPARGGRQVPCRMNIRPEGR